MALVGILLVGALVATKLNVSVGTLDGLILYANILQLNIAIFSPGKAAVCFQCLHCLVEFRPWSWNMLLQWAWCICKNVAAVCVPHLHMADHDYDHCLQPLQHHCGQDKWQKCSPSSDNSVSAILCKATSSQCFHLLQCGFMMAMYCTYKASMSPYY